VGVETLGKYQRFVVVDLPDLIDVYVGLCLDSNFKYEMQIETEHELRVLEVGQTQLNGLQGPQGDVEKSCLF
jgi:hypothetical protein